MGMYILICNIIEELTPLCLHWKQISTSLLCWILAKQDFYNVQLNHYEAAPCFIQFSQILTCECLLISGFFPKFTLAEPLMFKIILGSAQVNSGENTEINKQSYVKFWLNWIKYGAVLYSLSCTFLFPFTLELKIIFSLWP